MSIHLPLRIPDEAKVILDALNRIHNEPKVIPDYVPHLLDGSFDIRHATIGKRHDVACIPPVIKLILDVANGICSGTECIPDR